MPGHVTGNYTEHPLAELLPGNCPTDEMMRRLNLRFWDPWGISDSNYKKVSVVDFLNGKVRPGTPMEDSFDIIVEPDKSRIIHSVIVIVPIGTAANPQSLEILGTHVKAIIRAGRQPIVVCNFINSVSDENEVEEKAKKIRTAMYLPERSVIKFDNYVEEKTRNMEKDLQYWRILRLAYMNAITYLLSHPRECYLEGTPTTATATTIPAYSPPDRSAPTTATLAVLLDQVEVVDGSNARVTSNLWGIPNNKKLSAVRSDVDETGEFKGISPWVFVDAADVPVPTTKEAELTLRQILRSGDTLSIRVQMSTKPKAVSCSLGVYQAKPKSSSTPEYLYDIEVPENFLDRSVEWLTQQLGADILVRSRVAKVAPPARPKVALRSVVDVIDGKTVVYVAG
ncbi:hypothetical protein Pelo_6045 [Pelomyxa schiedti]|nr:hypothetical protein Pelo_6045 [Pelomyxa schiedti]